MEGHNLTNIQQQGCTAKKDKDPDNAPQLLYQYIQYVAYEYVENVP